MAVPGLPTATVMRACGNLSRIALSAGRLKTTSPSWPKSMTRILRGSKVMVAVRNLLCLAQIAPCHLRGLLYSQQAEDRRRNVFEGRAFAQLQAEGSLVNQVKGNEVGGVR